MPQHPPSSINTRQKISQILLFASYKVEQNSQIIFLNLIIFQYGFVLISFGNWQNWRFLCSTKNWHERFIRQQWQQDLSAYKGKLNWQKRDGICRLIRNHFSPLLPGDVKGSGAVWVRWFTFVTTSARWIVIAKWIIGQLHWFGSVCLISIQYF